MHLTRVFTCLRIIKGIEFLTIWEFRRFDLATRRGFASASISTPNVFTFAVATRSIRDGKRGWARAGAGQRRARQKEGRWEKEEHLTLWLGCLPHTADPDAAPANPRRATCVNKRIESVLVTWSSVLSSRFSSTVPFCFTSLQLIPHPYHFLSLSAVLERFSVLTLCKYSYFYSRFSTVVDSHNSSFPTLFPSAFLPLVT